MNSRSSRIEEEFDNSEMIRIQVVEVIVGEVNLWVANDLVTEESVHISEALSIGLALPCNVVVDELERLDYVVIIDTLG